jgi:hypothetical protein
MSILMQQREVLAQVFLHPKRHILVEIHMSHYAFDHQHLGEKYISVNQLQSFSNELFLFQTEVILQEEFCNLYNC